MSRRELEYPVITLEENIAISNREKADGQAVCKDT